MISRSGRCVVLIPDETFVGLSFVRFLLFENFFEKMLYFKKYV